MKKNKSKWLIQGASGAICFGSGFSLAAEASHWKHSNEAFWLWGISGTLGIGLMILGIIIFINNSKK